MERWNNGICWDMDSEYNFFDINNPTQFLRFQPSTCSSISCLCHIHTPHSNGICSFSEIYMTRGSIHLLLPLELVYSKSAIYFIYLYSPTFCEDVEHLIYCDFNECSRPPQWNICGRRRARIQWNRFWIIKIFLYNRKLEGLLHWDIRKQCKFACERA